MRFVLYANASEVKFGEEGYVAQYEFFCIEEKVHIHRETKYDLGYETASGLSKSRWYTPTACNGSCRAWLEKEMNIPTAHKQRCLELLKENADPAPNNDVLALHLHQSQSESWYAIGTFRDKSVGKRGQLVIAESIPQSRIGDIIALIKIGNQC